METFRTVLKKANTVFGTTLHRTMTLMNFIFCKKRIFGSKSPKHPLWLGCSVGAGQYGRGSIVSGLGYSSSECSVYSKLR